MLKGHLPRVMYHQVYTYTKINEETNLTRAELETLHGKGGGSDVLLLVEEVLDDGGREDQVLACPGVPGLIPDKVISDIKCFRKGDL